MKNIVNILLFFMLTGLASAGPFRVGEKVLEIPSPKGFSLVTPKMNAVHRLSLQMDDHANDSLAYYIAESDVPVAMSGEMPSLERYFILKVNKKLKDLVVGSKDFTEFKTVIKQTNKQTFKSVEAKMPSLMDKTSKGISKEFDVDFAMKLSQLVPLDPHYETKNALAYSMYMNYGVAVDGSNEDFIVSGTATFVNVAGKILFLYCYGPKEELEWTRSASETWARMVMESNSQPPSKTPGSGGFDWSRILEKGIVGAIIGGLIALMFGIFSSFKKKD